ncbi:YjbF family lipoprotein [Marinovum sp.]|uniref:YjbF family lipoprotein n=1 Tax=Marinovum sp. TaxID=2024839 RepID=UPI002B275381|nr:YjbF family lipoprotein [Marinovum sp.]
MTQVQRRTGRFGLGKLLALGCATLLAACSGGENLSSDAGSLVRDTFANRLSGRGNSGPARVTPEQAQQAAAQSTQPLVLIDFPRVGSNALILKIAQNGPVTTFATASRQTVSLENGLARGSRGLGGDLMSASFGNLPSLIANRRSGTIRREMRFLDGEDITVRFQFTCEVQVDGPSPVVKGTTAMIETCKEDGTWFVFNNKYAVDGRGRVVASEQWFGNRLGMANLKHLRF